MNDAIIGEPPVHRDRELADRADIIVNKPENLLPRRRLRFLIDVQRAHAVRLVNRPLVPADEIDDAGLAADLGLHERLEKPVQAGRLQVPVGDQHPLTVGGENPGHVRERHRPPRSALERVERDDLADATRLRRSHMRHFALLTDLAPQ